MQKQKVSCGLQRVSLQLNETCTCTRARPVSVLCPANPPSGSEEFHCTHVSLQLLVVFKRMKTNYEGGRGCGDKSFLNKPNPTLFAQRATPFYRNSLLAVHSLFGWHALKWWGRKKKSSRAEKSANKTRGAAGSSVCTKAVRRRHSCGCCSPGFKDSVILVWLHSNSAPWDFTLWFHVWV